MSAFGRHLTAVVLAAAITLTAAVLSPGPASAEPPVAVDDHVRMYPGEFRVVDVLGNDSDPDGDGDLTVCRVKVPDDANAEVIAHNGELLVFAFGRRTGDLAITYYACDYETLVPATLTISFKAIKRVTVTKAERPGRLRVTNPNDRRIVFLYGRPRAERPDGRLRIEAHDSAVVRVHRHRIAWVAIIGRGAIAGSGRVRGIELPGDRGRTAHEPVGLSRTEARAWASHRPGTS